MSLCTVVVISLGFAGAIGFHTFTRSSPRRDDPWARRAAMPIFGHEQAKMLGYVNGIFVNARRVVMSIVMARRENEEIF